MKKSIIISIIVVLILGFATSVNAYSTDDYTVDIPSDYQEKMTAVFAKNDGHSFNVQITKYDEKDGYPYTQKMLDKLAEELESQSSLKINSKEITKCTKNNYKCMHIESTYLGVECDQYAIVSGNKIYTLTLSARNKEDFNNAEMKGILDSFTLKNYKEPQEGLSPVLIGAIVGAGVGLLLAVVSVVKKKNENSTSTKVEEKENKE